MRKLVALAPERIESSPQCWALLGRAHALGLLHLVVVDEAHCVETHGEEFRGAFHILGDLRTAAPDVPWLLATATASPASVELIAARLGVARSLVERASSARPQMQYRVMWCSEMDARRALVASMADCLLRGKRVLVYVNARARAEELAAYVQSELRMLPKHSAVVVLPYHAMLPPLTRQRREAEWCGGQADGERCIDAMVATIAFGMGMDVPDVGLVVDYDVPRCLWSLYQQESRAGRDNEPSEGLAFFSMARFITLLERRQGSFSSSQLGERYGLALSEELLRYALETRVCRHALFERSLGGFDSRMCCRGLQMRNEEPGPLCDVCAAAAATHRQQLFTHMSRSSMPLATPCPAHASTPSTVPLIASPLSTSSPDVAPIWSAECERSEQVVGVTSLSPDDGRDKLVVTIYREQWVAQLVDLVHRLERERVAHGRLARVSARSVVTEWRKDDSAPLPVWVREPLLGHAMLHGLLERSFQYLEWTHRETGVPHDGSNAFDAAC
jgi:superfamily II DNA helicase RecQ